MTDQESQVQRSRSPAYPYLSLPEAVGLLETFYKAYRFNKVPLAVALKEMGYSITSGSGARVASTLTQYGLFESDGSKDNRRIWISSLGKAIAWENPSNPGERKQAIREAALKPEMHQWVFATYDLGVNALPPDDYLEYELVNTMGFTDKAAHAFIKEFKETYEYARFNFPEEKEIEIQNTAEISQPAIISEGQAAVNTPQAIADTDEVTTRLTGHKIARLIIPTNMNRKDFDLLVKWLALLSEAAMYEEESDNEDDREIPF